MVRSRCVVVHVLTFHSHPDNLVVTDVVACRAVAVWHWSYCIGEADIASMQHEFVACVAVATVGRSYSYHHVVLVAVSVCVLYCGCCVVSETVCCADEHESCDCCSDDSSHITFCF